MSDAFKETTVHAKDVLSQDNGNCDTAFREKVKETRDKLSSMLSDLNTKVDDLGATMKAKGQQAGDKVKEGVHGTSKCIEENPLSSVGIALIAGIGIGIAISAIMSRK